MGSSRRAAGEHFRTVLAGTQQRTMRACIPSAMAHLLLPMGLLTRAHVVTCYHKLAQKMGSTRRAAGEHFRTVLAGTQQRTMRSIITTSQRPREEGEARLA